MWLLIIIFVCVLFYPYITEQEEKIQMAQQIAKEKEIRRTERIFLYDSYIAKLKNEELVTKLVDRLESIINDRIKDGNIHPISAPNATLYFHFEQKSISGSHHINYSEFGYECIIEDMGVIALSDLVASELNHRLPDIKITSIHDDPARNEFIDILPTISVDISSKVRLLKTL